MDGQQLTAEVLKNLLHYDPSTGNFTWIRQCGKRGTPGKIAGTVDFGGYVVITISKKRHKAHRLAWLYTHGTWPSIAIDHINGIKTDNRLANLRQADWSQNQHNRRLQANNSSGYMGVSFDKGAGRFRAAIHADGRGRALGSFETAVQAHGAYLEAKALLHPFQPIPRDA